MQKALYRFLLFSGCLLFVSCSGILDDVSKKDNSIVCSLDFSSVKAARAATAGTEGKYTVDLIMRDATTGAAIQEQTVSAETTAVITFDSVAVGTSVGFSGTLSYNDSVCGAITSSVYTIAEGENPVAITISRLYTVTFDANGGAGTMSSQTFTAGVAQELTAGAFTRDGYAFLGWAAESDATEATYTDGQSVTMTADTTLYAVWGYMVTFNANGGVGTMSSQSFATGVAQALTANVFTRSGYTFLGWAAESDATKAAYTDGQSVTMTADTTLYAVWNYTTYSEDFVSTHFTSDKVFDVQHTQDTTAKTINVHGVNAPYSNVTKARITWSAGQYIQFAALDDAGNFSETLYNSDGTQSAVLSTTGTIKYVGDYGFLYIGGTYGTYVFTQKAINELGGTPNSTTNKTYPYTLESVTALSQLQNF